MRTRRSPRSGVVLLRLVNGALLAVMALGAQTGCTREFYREWANQDVSETVFEKSRDPRFRLDTFSVEGPALSRFADPYDQDVPPAPPDDIAAEALSPVPQWPDNRMLIPIEGTGYLDLMEYWKRQEEAQVGASGVPPQPVNHPVMIPGLAPAELAPTPTPEPSGVAGLPPNLGVGGFPPTISTDPYSRPGIPFEPYPGMVNPYAPGTVYGPGAGPPAGPAAQPQPAAPGALPPSLPGWFGRGLGTPIAPGPGLPPGEPPRVSPGSPFLGPSSVSPGSPTTGPSNVSPGSPGVVPRAPNPGGPGASLSPRTPNPAQSAQPVVQIVRLQDDQAWREAPAARRSAQIPPPPDANLGTNARRSTPISLSSARPAAARSKIPPPRSASSFSIVPAVRSRGPKDPSVKSAAFQEPAPAAPPTPRGGSPAMPPARLDLPTPLPGQPPVPPAAVAAPFQPTQPPLDRRQIAEAGRMDQAEAVGLAAVLVAYAPPMDEAEMAGLPKGSKAYKINMHQSFLLGLINGRYYQFQLEQLYLAALPVTLQRFAFEPQFYAGLSPLTGVPQTAGPGGSSTSIGGGRFPTTSVSGLNQFTYATRFSPTGQISSLNIGTVAGFGKLFSTGGQLLMGFANELVFNFVGKNPQQPTVLSALPITFVQPLLRGGGRAVILEPLTQAERNLLYQVRAFAQFRQQFLVVTLTGGTVQNFGSSFPLAGFSSAGNTDPTVGFIPVAQNVAQVEIDRRNVAFYNNLVRLYRELIQGEASGLTQLQVDQVMSSLVSALQTLYNDKFTYRFSLDQFKMQLGLPPDLPIYIDQSLFQPFYVVFDNMDAWQKNPNRTLSELPGIVQKLPVLEDIDVDGRSALGIYRNYRAEAKGEFVPENEDSLEDLLQAAVRIALEYRLDMMNNRAALYDAWRQIRVVANTLQGFLNVAVTNQVFTGPNTTNPFAFLSQAKNFALTLNAELPLVRVNERNNFRTAVINYQRARRSLMSAEDNIKIQLRQDLRLVHFWYISYEINKRIYELNMRLKDQSFEQIVAPPAGGTQALAQNASAATQTTNLLNFQRATYTAQVALTTSYQTYEQYRLTFYRDIGTLPYDEWEAFSELFPTEYHGPIIGHADGNPGPTPGATAPPPPRVGQ